MGTWRAVLVVSVWSLAGLAVGAPTPTVDATGLFIDSPFTLSPDEVPVEEADSDKLDGSDRFRGSDGGVEVWVRAYRAAGSEWPEGLTLEQRVVAAMNAFRAESGMAEGKIESREEIPLGGIPADRVVFSGEASVGTVRGRLTVVRIGFRQWMVFVRNRVGDPAADALAQKISDSVSVDPRLKASSEAPWFDAAEGRVRLQTPARLARDDRAVPATLPEPLSAVFVYRGLANEVLVDLAVNVHKREVGVDLIAAAEAAARAVRTQDPSAVVRLGGTRVGGAVAARVEGTFSSGGRKFGFIRVFFVAGDCDGRLILIWPDGNADAAAWAEYTAEALKPGPKRPD